MYYHLRVTVQNPDRFDEKTNQKIKGSTFQLPIATNARTPGGAYRRYYGATPRHIIDRVIAETLVRGRWRSKEHVARQ